MAAKGNTFAADVLKLVLNGVAIANIADNAASAPLTNLYISLHTSSPGAGGNQTTSECAYTSYARVAISRSSGSPAWTVTGTSASPNSNVSFPAATGGSETATYAGVGTSSSGTGKLLWFGAISPTISISSGVTPQLTTSSVVTES